MKFDVAHITSLFENATEGMVVSDKEGTIILINPSAGRMFGYALEELDGQKIEVLIPKNFKQGHVALREGFYQHPTNRIMGHNRDLHGQRRDGSVFPVEVSLSTYLRDDARYVIAFIIDITGRKAIENDMNEQRGQLERVTDEMRELNADLETKVEERTVILKEALEKLEQSQSELKTALQNEKQLNEMKSRFLSMASHEFRTPLSTVLSSAGLVEKYASESDRGNRKRHIDKIRNSVHHLNDLLQEFLSLEKIEGGKVKIAPKVFPFHPLILETMAELKESAAHDVILNYSGHTEGSINTDSNLFRNILVNLLSNAIKFSPPGKAISVNAGLHETGLTVSVTDEGIGIDPEDRQHLFSSFYRGRNAVNIQGTGLGLHIVKRYLDLLGGSISIDSMPVGGTCARFTIPESLTI